MARPRTDSHSHGRIVSDRTGNRVIEGDVSQRSILGAVTFNKSEHGFAAAFATSSAGLYESTRAVDGISTGIGWIILPSGEEVGLRSRGDDHQPAPRLDVATLTASDNGEQIHAQPVAVDQPVIIR